jgi:hypothetical protein
VHDDVTIATDDLEEARDSRAPRPSSPPTSSTPLLMRVKPRLAARALQMVCRLFSYDAELDLARHFNTYLTDNDEYRAINLLHLGGTIAFDPRHITVTLDRPSSPRIARALRQLLVGLGYGPTA